MGAGEGKVGAYAHYEAIGQPINFLRRFVVKEIFFNNQQVVYNNCEGDSNDSWCSYIYKQIKFL